VFKGSRLNVQWTEVRPQEPRAAVVNAIFFTFGLDMVRIANHCRQWSPVLLLLRVRVTTKWIHGSKMLLISDPFGHHGQSYGSLK
jgi:hypothetical protein